jgi:hypothetical protein
MVVRSTVVEAEAETVGQRRPEKELFQALQPRQAAGLRVSERARYWGVHR